VPDAIGQGWFFAKPKSVDELVIYLNNNSSF
jgi:sensor c-di-GMP phosphodiesterase-like protein